MRTSGWIKTTSQLVREGWKALQEWFDQGKMLRHDAWNLTNVFGTFPRRQHYIEYLVSLVVKAKLDPVTIFDLNDLRQELRRRGKVPPTQDQDMSDQAYLNACIQV